MTCTVTIMKAGEFGTHDVTRDALDKMAADAAEREKLGKRIPFYSPIEGNPRALRERQVIGFLVNLRRVGDDLLGDLTINVRNAEFMLGDKPRLLGVE